jgi:hypothetical protein
MFLKSDHKKEKLPDLQYSSYPIPIIFFRKVKANTQFVR